MPGTKPGFRYLPFILWLGVLMGLVGNTHSATAGTPTPEGIRALLDAGQTSEAESQAKELLQVASSKEGPTSLSAARAMDLIVEARDKGGKADSIETLPLARNAVSIKERILGDNHPDVATSLELLGITMQLLERYDDAATRLQRALSIREAVKPPDPVALATCLQRVANLKIQTGDYVTSRQLFERLIPLLEGEKGPQNSVLAGPLYNMGRCLYRLGDMPGAKKCFERARGIVVREYGKDHLLNAWISNSLGNLHTDTGDFDLARIDYEEAIRVAGLTHRDDFISSCLSNLGSLFRDFGDYVSAETSFVRALDIEKSIYGPRSVEAARTIYNLARLYYLAGEPGRAVPLAATSLAIRRDALGPDHNEVGDSLWLLGLCRLDTGDPAEAVSLLQRAKTIFEARLGPKHWDVSEAMYGLARAKEEIGNTDGAIAMYRAALKIKETTVGPDHPFMGEISRDFATLLARTGHREKAFGLAVRSARVVDQHVEAMITTFPERQALRFAAVSKRNLDVALSMMDARSSPATISECWDALIRSRALVVQEMARRNQSVGETIDPEVARLEDERTAASRRLAHLLVRGPESEENPGSYRNQVDEARRGMEDTERRLAAKSRPFRDTRAGTQVGFKEVGEALPKGSALVAFVLYEDALRVNGEAEHARSGTPSYLAFVLRPGDSPNVIPLGPAAIVDTLVMELRRESAVPESERSYRDVGTKLRKRVWDALLPSLGGAHRVFLIPDGTLSFVNFYALPVDTDRYVVDQALLLQPLVAERDLVSLGKEAKLGKGLLVVGGPDFEQNVASLATGESHTIILTPRLHRGKPSGCEALQSVRFEPLPASVEEAKAVATLWRKQIGDPSRSVSDDVLLLEGPQATEAAFKSSAPGRRILHVATHGFFLGEDCNDVGVGGRGISGHSPKKPEAVSGNLFDDTSLYLSGLVLAGANRRNEIGSDNEDGILTAEEISALDLRGVEWAVLSACESGLGTFEAREGIRGLRCAFQAAGVHSLIMSLWSVDDRATREWMTDLYEMHFSRKLNTAESIREASREVLASRRGQGMTTHPFFWAGFVATGDWR